MKTLGAKMTDTEVREMIKDVDLNGDGMIDYNGMRMRGDVTSFMSLHVCPSVCCWYLFLHLFPHLSHYIIC